MKKSKKIKLLYLNLILSSFFLIGCSSNEENIVLTPAQVEISFGVMTEIDFHPVNVNYRGEAIYGLLTGYELDDVLNGLGIVAPPVSIPNFSFSLELIEYELVDEEQIISTDELFPANETIISTDVIVFFRDLVFEVAGTFTYRITQEVLTSYELTDNLTIDPFDLFFTITVYEDLETQSLSATISFKGESSFVFINHYTSDISWLIQETTRTNHEYQMREIYNRGYIYLMHEGVLTRFYIHQGGQSQVAPYGNEYYDDEYNDEEDPYEE